MRETINAKYITPQNICNIEITRAAGATGIKSDNPVADCKLKLINNKSSQD